MKTDQIIVVPVATYLNVYLNTNCERIWRIFSIRASKRIHCIYKQV